MKNENVKKVLKLSIAAIVLLIVLRLAFVLLNSFTGFGNDPVLQSPDGDATGVVTEAPLQIFTDAETYEPEETEDSLIIETTEAVSSPEETVSDDVVTEETVQEVIEPLTEEVTESPADYDDETAYVFRNSKLLNDHYKKHGEEMGFASAEEYEKAASAVVNSPDALHKKEKDDNDDVYYIEDTNEFVVVSSDGYLRTYFLPDKGKAYYDRQ